MKCGLIASTALVISLQLVTLRSERRSTMTTQDATKLPASHLHRTTVHPHQQPHRLRRLKETEDPDKIRKDAAVSGDHCEIYKIGPGDSENDNDDDDEVFDRLPVTGNCSASQPNPLIVCLCVVVIIIIILFTK